MAANMQQMGGAGGMMQPQRQQLQMNELLATHLRRHQESQNWPGWQGQVELKDRLSKAHNLYVHCTILLSGAPAPQSQAHQLILQY